VLHIQSQPLKVVTAQWIKQYLQGKRGLGPFSFSISPKPRIICGLRGAIVKIAVAPSSSSFNYAHSLATFGEDEMVTSLHKSISAEFQRVCAFLDTKMVRFCGVCGHSITAECNSCAIFSFYRHLSFLNVKIIRQIVQNEKQWTAEQLPVPASLLDVLSISEDSTAAASAVCSMFNSLNEKQLRNMVFVGHHSRPLTLSATHCSSFSNFIQSFGHDCLRLRPNIESNHQLHQSWGDILHCVLKNFCSAGNNDWIAAKVAFAYLPVFDIMTTGCPDALFRSIPLELKSVGSAEEIFSGSRKWLRQISVYQRSHAPESHRALLVVADRRSQNILAYEVSPCNVPQFDSYCEQQFAKRPALALYLDAIRPYCNASTIDSTRSSTLCEIFKEQKVIAKSVIAAHALLLQTDLEHHFSTATSFVSSHVPSAVQGNSEFANVGVTVPDFGRLFVCLGTLTRLFDVLKQEENRSSMEQSYTRALNLLMDSARASRDAAVVSFENGDLPAVFRSHKFIKSLASVLRHSAESTLGIQAMSPSCMQHRMNELNALAHMVVLQCPDQFQKTF